MATTYQNFKQSLKKGFKGIQNAIVGSKTTNYGFTLLKSDIKKCKLDDNETSLVVDGQKLKQIIIGSYVFDLSHNYIPGNYPTLEQVKADAVLDTIKNLVNAFDDEESVYAEIVEKSAKEATEANDANVAKTAAKTAAEAKNAAAKAAAKAKSAAEAAKSAAEAAAEAEATESATALVTVPATEKCPSADIGINDITNESCKNRRELLLKIHPTNNLGCEGESTEKMKKFNELCSNKSDEIKNNDVNRIKNGGKKLRKSKSKKGGKRRKTARARK